MADIIPSDGKSAAWLTNYINKVVSIGTSLGLPAAQLKASQTKAQQLITELANVDAARAAYNKTVASKEAQKKDSLAVVRGIIKVMKANPQWTDAMAKDLQAERIKPAIDSTTYKGKLTAKLDSGGIRLRMSKKGLDAIAIYSCLPGQSTFTLLEKVTRSTYIDKRPLATPGIAEIRKYQVKGIIADQEIGHMSDIVTISFGG